MRLLLGTEAGRQELEDLTLCAPPDVPAEALDQIERRRNNALPPHLFDKRAHQRNAIVGTEGRRQEPGRQRTIDAGVERAKAEGLLDLT